MKEEWAITSKDALEAIKLINEYLTQGGTGFDDDALGRVAEALAWADRVRIVKSEEELDEEY
jgi:hypothetical protein